MTPPRSRQIRVLPLEPDSEREVLKPILPLASLDGIERAALQLLQAVREARGDVASTAAPSHTPSLVEVCNEFLTAKANAGRSENYLRVTHTQLTQFCKGREQRTAASVTAREIEAWLYAQPWAQVTRRNLLMTLRTVFAFAVSRGLIVGNVADGVDVPTVEDKPPGIHTPGQVAVVLSLARTHDADLCRWLAVRYFAGLRGSEAASLDESCIQPERGFIEVTAAKSKTRRRRLVTIQPALASWLDVGGRLPLGDVNTKLWRLTNALAFEWPRNVTRHSFVSYHLAAFGSASKTALEAGHTEQMLFNHYREIVTPGQAAEFWSIRPK